MKTVLKFFTGLFILLVVIGVASFFYFSTLTQPVNPENLSKISFEIPKGQSVSAIGQRLETAGIIRSGFLFRVRVWQKDLGQRIQAGTFLLSPSMSMDQVMHELTTGTNDMWVTIPEGWRREEIADMLASQEFDAFKKDEFLTLTKNDEGYLFPDTYLIPRAATTESIRNMLKDNFEKKVTTVLAKDIAESGHSLSDVITLASLVQREARQPETMKMVAGILWNRVNIGMALNVDATLQYIHGYDRVEKSWWSDPTADLKESTSHYNTYKYPGLPPGPIGNPGLNAITAALHPRDTNYMFYVTDRLGTMHYAQTLEEHNRFVQQYLR